MHGRMKTKVQLNLCMYSNKLKEMLPGSRTTSIYLKCLTCICAGAYVLGLFLVKYALGDVSGSSSFAKFNQWAQVFVHIVVFRFPRPQIAVCPKFFGKD